MRNASAGENTISKIEERDRDLMALRKTLRIVTMQMSGLKKFKLVIRVKKAG